MYFTLLVVVILTAIALVAVALGIARAISPRSYNPQKGEAYSSGQYHQHWNGNKETGHKIYPL